MKETYRKTDVLKFLPIQAMRDKNVVLSLLEGFYGRDPFNKKMALPREVSSLVDYMRRHVESLGLDIFEENSFSAFLLSSLSEVTQSPDGVWNDSVLTPKRWQYFSRQFLESVVGEESLLKLSRRSMESQFSQTELYAIKNKDIDCLSFHGILTKFLRKSDPFQKTSLYQLYLKSEEIPLLLFDQMGPEKLRILQSECREKFGVHFPLVLSPQSVSQVFDESYFQKNLVPETEKKFLKSLCQVASTFE